MQNTLFRTAPKIFFFGTHIKSIWTHQCSHFRADHQQTRIIHNKTHWLLVQS